MARTNNKRNSRLMLLKCIDRVGEFTAPCADCSNKQKGHKQLNELRECTNKRWRLAKEDERRKSGGVINENETAK